MPLLKTLYVNIVECADLSYYTGVTNNIVRRLWESSNATGPKSYTASRLPITLKYLGFLMTQQMQ